MSTGQGSTSTGVIVTGQSRFPTPLDTAVSDRDQVKRAMLYASLSLFTFHLSDLSGKRPTEK